MRKWYVDKAIHSTRSLLEIINDLTLEEAMAALQIESASRRRSRIIRRLIGRAVRLNEHNFKLHLEERFLNGTST